MGARTSLNGGVRPTPFLQRTQGAAHVYRPGKELSGKLILDCPTPVVIRSIHLDFTGTIQTTWWFASKPNQRDSATYKLFSLNQRLLPTETRTASGRMEWDFSQKFPSTTSVQNGCCEKLPPSLARNFGNNNTITITYNLNFSVDILDMQKINSTWRVNFEPLSELPPGSGPRSPLQSAETKHIYDACTTKRKQTFARLTMTNPPTTSGVEISIAIPQHLRISETLTLEILAKPLGDHSTTPQNQLKLTSITYTHTQHLHLPDTYQRTFTEQSHTSTLQWSVLDPNWPRLLPFHDKPLRCALGKVPGKFQPSFCVGAFERRHWVEVKAVFEGEDGREFKVKKRFGVVVYATGASQEQVLTDAVVAARCSARASDTMVRLSTVLETGEEEEDDGGEAERRSHGLENGKDEVTATDGSASPPPYGVGADIGLAI